MQYFFNKCLADCKITDANFHALRHTFATRAVESGFEIKSLSEILGHTKFQINS
jgi:site-specific recombinase XerD